MDNPWATLEAALSRFDAGLVLSLEQAETQQRPDDEVLAHFKNYRLGQIRLCS